MWTAVEESTVRTPKEIWEDLRQQGWPVEVRQFCRVCYYFIPGLTCYKYHRYVERSVWARTRSLSVEFPFLHPDELRCAAAVQPALLVSLTDS